MITADLILPNLHATSKKQAFRTLAQESLKLFNSNPEEILNTLQDRERIGSTGIGLGVAIPHIKIAGIKKMYGVLARLETPVDYDAIDGQPVDIIFMLIAPADSVTTQHLKMLAQISRFLKDQKTCQSIRATQSHEQISALLSEWAKNQAA